MTGQVGDFVWAADGLGFGKIAALRDGAVEVAFFASITSSFRRSYPPDRLLAAPLPAQQRAYIRGEERWGLGRVTGPSPLQERAYEVRLPNGKVLDLPVDQIEVRCSRPLGDPTEVLAAGGIETQFIHDRRMAAVREMLRAREAARGLTGLLSAAVAIVPYQVEVIRRVLNDPVQRYLLADEVGMGKTIEAGAILRQILLDDRAARALVLVPPALVRQWDAELREKFDIDQFLDRVTIAPHDALDRPPAGGWDTVIIDEAHHLVTDTTGVRFGRLRGLAETARRLFLLSATPVLGTDGATLAMLHLLDPVAHPLDDRVGFARKVELRQEYGHILLALNPDGGIFSLRRAAARALDAFSEDPVVAELAGPLASVTREHDPEATAATVRVLKRHIAETYRLHQRLIRTRRKSAAGWALPARGGKVTVDADADERIPALADVLDSWRIAAAHSAEPRSDAERALARRYVALWEALGRGADELAGVLDAPAAPTFADEPEIVRGARRALAMEAGDSSRAEVAATSARLALRALPLPSAGGPRRLVAFTSSTAFARVLLPHLRRMIGRSAVFAVLDGMDEDAVEDAVEQFDATTLDAVLVCDRSGEEGLNLHRAGGILHLDLPLAPARLEQRIGRLDRFGRSEPAIAQRVLLPSDDDDSPWLAWLELLRNGFLLFDAPISDVQFLLGQIEQEAALALFRDGAAGLRAYGVTLGESLTAERARLDEQYALDDLSLGADGGDAAFAALERFERDERPFARAMQEWIVQTLQFGFAPREQPPESFALRWTRNTLLPERPWRGLFSEALDRPLTYRRADAIRPHGARLVRPGFPLVDRVEQFLRWDDRGSVFATWRCEPAWPEAEFGPWLGFRLCFAIEPSPDVLAAELRGVVQPALLPAVRRRADGVLPPWQQTLYVDVGLHEETRAPLLAVLDRPYTDKPDRAGRRDYNLGSRQEALWDLFGPEQFAELCRAARDRADRLVHASARFRTAMEGAERRVREELQVANERLARRDAALRRERGVGDPTIARELHINTAVAAAVAAPSVRLDAIGFLVISSRTPGGEA